MQINATTISDYLSQLTGKRKDDVAEIHKLIASAVPNLKPHIQCGMIGYGMYHYKYASGREGDWPVIGLASQKQHISIYMCVTEKGKYLAELNWKRLGKVNCGRSCIRFKKIEDVNLKALKELCKKAERLAAKGSFAA